MGYADEWGSGSRGTQSGRKAVAGCRRGRAVERVRPWNWYYHRQGLTPPSPLPAGVPVIVGYGGDAFSLAASTAAVLGKIACRGRLPVTVARG